MTRQETNAKLTTILMLLVAKYPEKRFSQILLNYGFVKQTRPAKPTEDIWINWQDEYFSEPEIILERVLRQLDNYKETL